MNIKVTNFYYLIAGILVSVGASGIIALPIGIVLMLGTLFVIKQMQAKKV